MTSSAHLLTSFLIASLHCVDENFHLDLLDSAVAVLVHLSKQFVEGTVVHGWGIRSRHHHGVEEFARLSLVKGTVLVTVKLLPDTFDGVFDRARLLDFWGQTVRESSVLLEDFVVKEQL